MFPVSLLTCALSKLRREDRLNKLVPIPTVASERINGAATLRLQATIIETLLFKQQLKQENPLVSVSNTESFEKAVDRQLRLLLSRVAQSRCRNNNLREQQLQSSIVNNGLHALGGGGATSVTQYRASVLQRCLGATEFRRIQSLVKRIQTLGRALVLPSSGGSIPLPVRRLFFETDLVTAWHHSSILTLATQSWPAFVAQAQAHLAETLAWVENEQA